MTCLHKWGMQKHIFGHIPGALWKVKSISLGIRNGMLSTRQELASFKNKRIYDTDECSPNKCWFEKGCKLISLIMFMLCSGKKNKYNKEQ